MASKGAGHSGDYHRVGIHCDLESGSRETKRLVGTDTYSSNTSSSSGAAAATAKAADDAEEDDDDDDEAADADVDDEAAALAGVGRMLRVSLMLLALVGVATGLLLALAASTAAATVGHGSGNDSSNNADTVTTAAASATRATALSQAALPGPHAPDPPVSPPGDSPALVAVRSSYNDRPIFHTRPLPVDWFGSPARFLHFPVVGQFNNQRQALTIALVFARFLNRTLVIPPDLTESLDLWNLAHFHPIVAAEDLPAPANERWDDLKLRTPPDEIVKIVDRADAFYLTQEDFLADPVQRTWINSHRAMEDAGPLSYQCRARFLLDELGPNSPTWNVERLLLDIGWGHLRVVFSGFSPSLMASVSHWAIQAVRLAPTAFEMSSRLRAHLPKEFIAVHWRIGDFEWHKDRRDRIPTAEKIIAFFRDKCGVTKEDAFTLYIASDNPSDSRIQSFVHSAASSLGLRVVLWSGLLAESVGHLGHLGTAHRQASSDGSFVGRVEALLMAQATFFLGTPGSTVSDHVLQLMPEYGSAHAALLARQPYDEQARFILSSFDAEHRPPDFKPSMLETPLAAHWRDLLFTQTPSASAADHEPA